MEIDYLCEFAEIAKLGSYCLAAEVLCISQSSLSKHIMALERELQVSLFDRSSRRVSLSDAGRAMLPLAEEATALRNRVQTTAAEQNRLGREIVRLASIPVMAQYDITGAIVRFTRENPDVVLSVSECESHDIPRLLESGQCDLAFTREFGERSGELESIDYCADRLVAVTAKDGPDKLPVSALAGQELLLLDKGTAIYEMCVELCRRAGFEPSVVYTGKRPENIVELVAEGMGTALLMKRHADFIRNPKVRTVELEPTISSSVCLSRQRGRKLSGSARRLWEYIAAMSG